jgi:hypothetical protein
MSRVGFTRPLPRTARLIEAKVARKLRRRIVRNAKAARLLSNEHFSVDSTLIESWAAITGMHRRDGNDEPPGPGCNPMVDIHGERRTNESHVSPSDPEALLARKGKGQAARLNYMGHVLMDHRCGLPVDVVVTAATASQSARRRSRRHAGCPSASTDAHLRRTRLTTWLNSCAACRDRGVTPHIAFNHNRSGGPSIYVRATQHARYRISHRIHKRITQGFGSGKDVRRLREMKVTVNAQVSYLTTLALGCYALLRRASDEAFGPIRSKNQCWKESCSVRIRTFQQPVRVPPHANS